MSRARRHRGFSLGEILVALAIVAVVAAAVIPTIIGQVTKADPQSVGDGALAMRAAVEAFVSDVQRYPLTVGQLTRRPNSAATGVVGGTYATVELLRWAGPYLSRD